MAERPIFLPMTEGNRLVREVSVTFGWHKGMAPSQKKKNIVALHDAASKRGFAPLLEISSKSEDKLGQRLSAFNLKIPVEDIGPIPLECAFQGGKVFERGGPFRDLYRVHPREAKRDPRLHGSGQLMLFSFGANNFPLKPKTAFYDWLYMRCIYDHREFLAILHKYAGFTDIEFNPKKSINCQARACATFVALDLTGLIDQAMSSPEAFIEVLSPDSAKEPHSNGGTQGQLFDG